MALKDSVLKVEDKIVQKDTVVKKEAEAQKQETLLRKFSQVNFDSLKRK